MKKLLVIALAAVFAIPMFNACKKGENDPFMSLKSRKARLTGEWKLAEGTQTEISGGTTETYTFSGSTVTYSGGGQTGTGTYMEEMEINKDHTFKRTITTQGGMETIEGTWTFGRKDKELELKNKEYIIIKTTKSLSTYGSTSTTYTYTGDQCPVSYAMIDQLKNKEMIVKMEGTRTGTSVSSVTGTMTYEKK